MSSNYALVDGSGVIVNVILADKEFIDSLPDLIADDAVDTGPFDGHKVVDLGAEPKAGIGWRRVDGEWTAPEPPEPLEPPTLEEN